MRYPVLATLLLIPALSLRAQATSSVLAGISVSKIVETDGNVSISTDNKTGFVVGLELASPIARGVFITPELLYVQKGFASTGDNNTQFTMKISYIEIPVLIRADLGDRPTRAFLFGGLHAAFKVGCSVGADGPAGSASDSCADAFDGDAVKSLDVGLTIGAGVKLRHFGLSARYDLGLTNIASNIEPGTTVKNKAFLFLASVEVK
jgi:hypothetical protein